MNKLKYRDNSSPNHMVVSRCMVPVKTNPIESLEGSKGFKARLWCLDNKTLTGISDMGQYWTAGWVGCLPFCTEAYPGTLTQHKMADTKYPRNLMVNSDIICSIVFWVFFFLKMPFSCGPCINMALRSEAWALTFTSLPEWSVCRIVRFFLCSCCAGLCVSAVTYLCSMCGSISQSE